MGDCIPDVTLVLDVDLTIARSRMKTPRRPDRMEQQPSEFYEQVRAAYRELAAREPNRVLLIDGSQTPDKIEDEIWKTLCSRFPNLTKSEVTGQKSEV